MGWNLIKNKNKNILFNGLDDNSRFYFVHTYHLIKINEDLTVADTNYSYDFTSAINKDNIYGVQFHPEKSHKFGMQLMRNFLTL